MATATRLHKSKSTPLCDIPPPWPMRRWTVEEYHRLSDEGFLDSRDKVELLFGWMKVKHPNRIDESRPWTEKSDIPPSWEMPRWTVEEYHRMIECGILGPNDKVELIYGWIVKKMSINPPHASAVSMLSTLLAVMLHPEYIIRTQNPLAADDSEPEPDLLIAPGPWSLYKRRHPSPPDAVLVVEVSDSSLRYDRTVKQKLYAETLVTVYWIVNLIDGLVEVYTQPRSGKYRKRTDYTAKQEVPVVLAKNTIGSIPVKEFLP